MVKRWWAAPAAAAAVALLAACGSTSSSSSGSSGGSSGGSSTSGQSAGTTSASASGIKTAGSGSSTVLVDSKGQTLYWFAIDTPTASKCTSSTCVHFWPPVLGKPSMASGATLNGKLGTIKRSNGQLQATYMGHPLYTFEADSVGKANGNGLKQDGGLWWAMTSSGAKLAKAPASSSSAGSGGGGGYGY